MVEFLIAFGLDLLIGDPLYSWHPVRIIGGWIQKTETWLRAHVPAAKLAGILQAIFIPAVVYGLVWFLTGLAGQIHPMMKSILVIYFFYSALSVKDLSTEAHRVHLALRNRHLEVARENLSRIVGRDTENLSETEVVRGAVETVAESFVDGVLSPLFYAAIGGAPLAMMYKAINTNDSMAGLRTSQYQEYGKAAAKLDEIANWIPARISWFLIGLAAYFVNGKAQEAWRVALQNLGGPNVTNGVIPEAAFAGALGVELGGINYYGGHEFETRKLGLAIRALEPSDIRRAVDLMKASSWTALFGAILLHSLVSLIFH